MAWTASRTVTFDHNQVPANQSNFPIVFVGTYSFLKSTGNGGEVTNASGFDIIFSTTADGSGLLDFERVVWDATTGAVEFWVKLPILSSISNTVIYILSGNAAVVTDQANPTGVWSGGFSAVYHLPNGSSLTADDSSPNANNGTVNSAAAVAGQIDGAANFPLSGDANINGGTGASLDDLVLNPPVTYSFWLKLTSQTMNGTILTKNDGYGDGVGWVIWPGPHLTPKIVFEQIQPTLDSNWATSADISLGTWMHVVIVYSGGFTSGDAVLYINGVSAAVAFQNGTGAQTTDAGTPLQIGGDGGFPGAGNRLDGSVDEVRILGGTALSADWVATEYNNQNNPSTFYVVTDTPLAAPDLVQVSSDPQFRMAAGEINPFYFHVGDQLYQVLATGGTAGSTEHKMGVFKRAESDAGGAWTEMDAAGAPDPLNIPVFAQSFYNSVTGFIAILYISSNPATGVTLVEFDTATDTYGTPTAELTLPANFGEKFVFVQRSDLTYVVLGTSTTHLYYATNAGGTWSGLTNIINAGVILFGGVIDPTDTIHFTLNQTAFVLDYRQLDASFTLSGATAIDTPIFLSGRGWPSIILYGAASVAVGYFLDRTAGPAKVAIGAPLAAPVFTNHTVFTPPLSDQAVSYVTPAEGISGDLNAFLVTIDYNTDPIVDEIRRFLFDGSNFNDQGVFYSVTADPPADNVADPVDQLIHATSNPIELTTGWSQAITLETDTGSPVQTFCTGFFLDIPAPPPPIPQTLTLQKVVQGGPAAPSDFTLIATGGSPETEISGPGPTVGPENVNAGTFELSEIGPGAGVWDSATSTWDGGTTWDGGGQYTPVWNCGDAIMPTPTSVIVPPGGGGPIPLGVTQVPDIDPTFQPLLSNGPFEFLIGGFLYQVLWNSGNRLGVFFRQASVGGTFTELDQGNAPTGISGYGRATSRGTKISICYMLPGNTTAQMVEFDASSGTWGTPSAVVTLPAVTNLFAWVRRSDNTDVFFGAWASHWYYITNIAGVWGAVTNLANATGTVIGGVIDSSDQSWIMINYPFGGNPAAVGLFPVSSTYVLGAAIANRQLIFQGPPYPYRFYPDVALYGTTAIAFAYSTAVNPTDLAGVRVSIIRPISAPVLTDFLAYISAAGQESYLLKLKDDGSGVLNMFFVNTEGARYQVFQMHWDDPFNWTAPTVFYDPSVTPPDHGSASQQISSLDPLPSNGWAVGAGMQTDQPTEITTAEIIQESSGGGSSDVVCTVTNFFNGPPPAPPGPGQMNPVGCFELLRVDATLTPARHLPTRGSVR